MRLMHRITGTSFSHELWLMSDRLLPVLAEILGQFRGLLRSYLSAGSYVLPYFPEYVFCF